jgi:cytochrome c oxidase cbb3-type subunit 4
MDLDINTLRGISTALALIAFVGVWIWAWSSKRKRAFDEAANLPFADDDIDQQSKGDRHDNQ